jgi:hypothetical protein
MTETPVPNEDHFARQCSGFGGKSFSDIEDGIHEVPYLHARAFEPSPKNRHPSGLWIERVADTWANQIERVRAEFKGSARKIGKTNQMAIVQVETVKALGARCSRELHVVHEPDDANGLPSHAEIRGIAPEDYVLQQLIADSAQIEPIFSGE